MDELNGKNLYEVLVPTEMPGVDAKGELNGKIVSCSIGHHRQWDSRVRDISGGLTVLSPTKGQWLDNETMTICEERVIPVRIACSREQLDTILSITLKHYRQKAVMAYRISSEVVVKHRDDA